ncbi:MAG: hypothetical protein AB8H79_20885 [Myxococcota bacterium]
MSGAVWFDANRERFWRVPPEHSIPAGTTQIRSLTGGACSADIDALSEFSLPRDQARRAVIEELRAATEHAGRAFGAAAADVWTQAAAQLPQDLSWQELEARLGPMTTWTQQVKSRADKLQIQQTAKQAQATLKRAGRVAGSAVRSAKAVGRVVLDNPEMVERASRWAEVFAGSTKPKDPKDR